MHGKNLASGPFKVRHGVEREKSFSYHLQVYSDLGLPAKQREVQDCKSLGYHKYSEVMQLLQKPQISRHCDFMKKKIPTKRERVSSMIISGLTLSAVRASTSETTLIR